MKSGKVAKGEYGYIAYQKKMSVIRTLIFFMIAILVFIVGMIVTHDRKNLFTVVSVLLCLPAAKSAVGAIMFLKAKGCSAEAWNKIPDCSSINGIYDIYLTSYESDYPLSHVCVWAGSVIGLAESGYDIQAAQKHITQHMAMDGYKDYTVKIFNDTDKYCERVRELMQLSDDSLQNSGIVNMLFAISL